MKLVFTFLMSCLSTMAYSQLGFTNTYGAFGLFNDAADLAVDSESNVFICGSTGGWGAINGDMTVIKTDSSGIQLWAKVYGDSTTQMGKAISLIPEGGFVAIATTNSGENNDYEIFMVKADADGNVVWEKKFGIGGWDEAADVTMLSDGGIAVVSSEWDAAGGSKSMVIRKFDADGNQLWISRPDNEAGFSEASSILELRDSTILIAGSGNLDNGDIDMLIVKYSYDGNQIWRQFYGVEIDEWIADLALTSDNRIGVAGNRQVDEMNISPQLLSLDTDGGILNEFFEPNYAETTAIAYNQLNNSYIFSWNYSSSGTEKTAIFNFTNDFVFGCNALPSAGVTTPLSASAVAISPSGKMHLCGQIRDTGPGITSILSFKCNESCQHDQSLLIGIEDKEKKVLVLPYPNPTSETVFLNFPEAHKVNYVALTDLLGHKIPLEFSLLSGNLHASVKDIPTGFYYLNISTDSDIQNRSIWQFPLMVIH